MNNHQNGCIGIVLAGGLSRRMGQNKSQLMRTQQASSQTMLSFSQELLTDAGVDRVVISASSENLTADSTLNKTDNKANIVPDLMPKLGPLGGIYSVFAQVPCQAALIIPVDLPLMNAKVLTQLKQAGQLLKQAVHFEQHSLPLYLPNNAYTELFFNQHLVQLSQSAKGPSIKALLAQMPHQSIRCLTPSTLTNTNTPDDWQQAQSQLLTPLRSY
ncbi:molybdenum cofactor guanylyltransferase [Thalassotalea euphylliae]|nr:molybdenum cofactor guanylyltransferase [Thalassotalea euphylliae]